MLNNEQLALEHKPVMNGSEIFIPLFPIFEELDATVFLHKDNSSIICLTAETSGRNKYNRDKLGKNQFRITCHY